MFYDRTQLHLDHQEHTSQVGKDEKRDIERISFVKKDAGARLVVWTAKPFMHSTHTHTPNP